MRALKTYADQYGPMHPSKMQKYHRVKDKLVVNPLWREHCAYIWRIDPDFKINPRLGFRVGKIGGYDVVVARQPKYNGGFRIAAGCRWFTYDEAKKHWKERRVDNFASRVVKRRATLMLKRLPSVLAKCRKLGWV